jgi:hypothetical protein
MERVIYTCKYVFNHLQRNKLIYEYQSGFLPKYSRVHQLLEIYNCILNSLEKRKKKFSRAKLEIFPDFNIRLYDKNSESDFFPSTKIRIFYPATLGIRIFFLEK